MNTKRLNDLSDSLNVLKGMIDKKIQTKNEAEKYLSAVNPEDRETYHPRSLEEDIAHHGKVIRGMLRSYDTILREMREEVENLLN